MDEQAEYEALLAELEQVKQEYEAWKANKPASERFFQGATLENFGKGVGDAIGGLVQLPAALPELAKTAGEDLGSRAAKNPALSTATLGTYPLLEAGYDYFANRTPEEAIVGIAEPIAGVVPGYVQTMRDRRETGEWPRAEKVGEYIAKDLGGIATGFGIGGALGQGAKILRGAKHGIIGKSPARQAYEAIVKEPTSKAVGEQMMKEMTPLTGRTPAGRMAAKEGFEGYSTLATDPKASEVIRSLSPTASSLDELLSTSKGASQLSKIDEIANSAALSRNAAIDKADLLANNANKLTLEGVVTNTASLGRNAKGVISARDIAGIEESLDILRQKSLSAGPGVPSILVQEIDDAAQVLDDIRPTSGKTVGFANDGIPRYDGLTPSQLQRKIEAIDDELARQGLYDKNPQAAIAEGRVAKSKGYVTTLSSIRNQLQDVLKLKLTELDPALASQYMQGNAIYGAVQKVKPLNQIFSTETGATGQVKQDVSLLGNMQGVVSGAGKALARMTGSDITDVGLRRSAIRQMQLALNTAKYRSPQRLLSRSIDMLANNKVQAGAVGMLAAQAGLVMFPEDFEQADAATKKAIAAQVIKAYPQAFEPPISGMQSEIDGKIQDPFESDQYIVKLFEETQENPANRAETLGKYLSTKKVARPMSYSPITEVPPNTIIELSPDVGGVFQSAEEMGQQRLKTDLMNATMTQQLLQWQY